MDKKLLFVYNPHAGKAQITDKLSEILDTFAKAGFLTTVWPTQRRGDASELIKRLGGDYGLVACSGGDGTLCEAVGGLMEIPAESRPLLGYIPAGSTNDFASTVGIPKNMTDAAEVMMKGLPFRCDIGAFNDKYFTYIAAFGAFTSVSYDTPQQTKNLLGHAAYVLEGIKQVGNIKPYKLRIESNGSVIEDEFLYGMVSNTMQVGGMKLIPSDMAVSLNDGLFEVFLIRAPKSMADIQAMISSALNQSYDNKGFLSFKTGKIRFTCEAAVPWTIDGEFGGECTDVVIENLSKSIGIIV